MIDCPGCKTKNEELAALRIVSLKLISENAELKNLLMKMREKSGRLGVLIQKRNLSPFEMLNIQDLIKELWQEGG